MSNKGAERGVDETRGPNREASPCTVKGEDCRQKSNASLQESQGTDHSCTRTQDSCQGTAPELALQSWAGCGSSGGRREVSIKAAAKSSMRGLGVSASWASAWGY